MTRAEVVAWLDARRPPPPPTLREHMARLAQDGPGSVPEQLADIGGALLARVMHRPDGSRELALDLLAADAFVTYAFEAQAEMDIGGLTPLARRVAGENA